MTIPLPDGTRAAISHGQVTTAEKSLGVWSAIESDNSKHIKENHREDNKLDQLYAKRTPPGMHGLDSL